MSAPSWQTELENFIGVKPLFTVEGNIDDIYPVNATSSFESLEAVLVQLFGARGYCLVLCDPLRGIRDVNTSNTPYEASGAASPLIQEAADLARQHYTDVRTSNPVMDAGSAEDSAPFVLNRLVENSMIIRALLTARLEAAAGKPVVCVFNLANRLASNPADLTPEENAVYMNLLIAVQDAIRPDGHSINALVTVSDRVASLPAWFYQGNPGQRVITIPTPDRGDREAYVDHAFGKDAVTPKAREKFIDTTDSMKLLELDEIRRLFLADHLHRAGEDLSELLTGLVEMYKYGIRENRWAEVAEKLKDDPLAILKRRVMGQDQALQRIVTVLKRSVMGLSGLQHSSAGKPKGVLFLAGPTGTGKTEVVKAVTELLFGDERSYQRFDMSEYSAENADQKLFGAPPGYVGYDQGGQLTNAVRENPFTVLLFDEIEKAHSSIMDKFLQILEDGRMTDGQGNTVYFGETLIFFTSNAGVSEEVRDISGHVVERKTRIKPGEPYEEMERKVIDALSVCFKPEVMGRIGDNVVVFNYISEEASRLIARSQIERIDRGIKMKLGIAIEVTDEAFDLLFSWARRPEVVDKGGRGIGNLIESDYLNPLSAFLFDASPAVGETVRVEAQEGTLVFVRAMNTPQAARTLKAEQAVQSFQKLPTNQT